MKSQNGETQSQKMRHIVPGALRKNALINQHARNLLFLLGGAMAGILGLSGWR